MKNYGAWDIEPLADPAAVPKENFYRHLVGWAILAPSTHNVQPWKFTLIPEQDTVVVRVAPEGILPVSDPIGRQAHISVGCALENLILAAEHYGLVCLRVEYLQEKIIYPSCAAEVFFEGAPKMNRDYSIPDVYVPILDAMKSRRVNRGLYDPKKPVPARTVKIMRQIAASHDVVFFVIADKLSRVAIAGIQSLADGAVILRTDFRQELADFLLPNDTESFRGMPGNTFGLTDEVAVYIHNELKKEKFDRQLAKNFAAGAKEQIMSSPLFCVIGVDEDNPEWWIKAGRAFERMALIATVNGLSIAVHAAMSEVDVVNQMLRMRLNAIQRPTVIFRLGYVLEERPHSPRMPAEQVTEVI